MLSSRHQVGKHLGRAMNSGGVILGGANRSFQGIVDIEGILTLGNSIGEERSGVVADHGAGVVAGKLPHGKHSTLLRFEQQRPEESVVEFGVDDGHQGMQRTESVPQREYGVDRSVGIALMYLAVHAEIAAVDIGEEVGGDGGVVHGGVEFHQVVMVGGHRHLDLAEVGVPLLAGCAAGLVESEIGHLNLHILTGAVVVDSRYTYLHQHLLAFLHRGEAQQSLAACVGVAVLVDDGVGDDAALEGLGELGVEVDLLVEGPVFRHLPSAYFGVAHHFERHLEIGLMLYGVVHVDDHACAVGGGIGEAVESHTLGGGHLGQDVVAVELHAVISRLGHLIFVRETGGKGEILLAVVLRVYHLISHGGHDEHIAVVGAAGAAEMGVREAVDQRVGHIVARRTVPAVDAGVGRGLYHAVRHHRPGEGVAVATGAYHRIH